MILYKDISVLSQREIDGIKMFYDIMVDLVMENVFDCFDFSQKCIFELLEEHQVTVFCIESESDSLFKAMWNLTFFYLSPSSFVCL